MGKKLKNDKRTIDSNLEIQMNLANDLAWRNPRLRVLAEKYPNRFADMVYNPSIDSKYREFDKLFTEIFGEVFPKFPFPVLRDKQHEKRPSELVLKIDLNYTKEEIFNVVERFFDSAANKYKSDHHIKHKRKNPQKWLDYLEIWDLKSGNGPWKKLDDGFKIPPPFFKGEGSQWTFEEIAKYKYPEDKEPEELQRAVDRIKKQYKAAYKLICGEKYSPNDAKQRFNQFVADNNNERVLCNKCKEQPDCDCLCPLMLEELAKYEVKRKQLLVSDSGKIDLEKFSKSRKSPSAD